MEDAVFFFALTLHTHADFATHQMSLQDMNTMGMIVRLKTNYTKSYMEGFCKFSRRERQRRR